MESGAGELSHITKEQQYKLAEYSKTGVFQKGLELSKPENLNQYRRLVFNVTFDILSTAYPICRKILDRQWKGLIEQFMSTQSCSNNQVWKMPFEFYQYINTHPVKEKQEYPFLADLLVFEWLEIELYSEEDKPVSKFKKNGNWLTNRLVINPHFRVLRYSYPVFRPYTDLSNAEIGDYYLLMLRDTQDLKVKFVEISALFYWALSINPNNFKEALLEVALSQFGIQDENVVIKKAQPTVELFFQKGLFLGYY